jgi:hypothetical protein
MSDWNEQAAPNNNLSSSTIRYSQLVGKQMKQNAEISTELKINTDSKMDGKDLAKHLKSRQPGM